MTSIKSPNGKGSEVRVLVTESNPHPLETLSTRFLRSLKSPPLFSFSLQLSRSVISIPSASSVKSQERPTSQPPKGTFVKTPNARNSPPKVKRDLTRSRKYCDKALFLSFRRAQRLKLYASDAEKGGKRKRVIKRSRRS